VQDAFDANGSYCGSFDRRQQGAAKSVADGGTEAALKRLRGELAVLLCESFGVDCETLGLLKTSPKHVYFSFSVLDAMHSANWRVVRLRVELWW
jgi:hypothetical protein